MRERRRNFRLAFVVLVNSMGLASVAAAEDTLWNLQELKRSPKVTWVDTSGPLRKLYYENEPRNGRPTRVFAYCAFPEDSEKPAPGIVLIHGGGGTAFPEWAELWAKRGYVALAMDLAGKGPEREALPDGGPDQTDAFKFPKTPVSLKEMWSYHAVAASIRAGSLLAALPEVDARRIAVTGISWGGYLTCIVAGLDDRFQAAVPVYGCGFLHENSVWLPRFAEMPPAWSQTWIKHFDPSVYVGRARMPMLFVNGTNDFAYPLDSYQKTYRLVEDRTLCVTVKMPHGHPAGWSPPEIGRFIDEHLRNGTPLPRIGLRMRVDEEQAMASVECEPKSDVTAFLHWTHDDGAWQERSWETVPALIQDGQIRATLPSKRPLTAFLTLTDRHGATVSTEHITRP